MPSIPTRIFMASSALSFLWPSPPDPADLVAAVVVPLEEAHLHCCPARSGQPDAGLDVDVESTDNDSDDCKDGDGTTIDNDDDGDDDDDGKDDGKDGRGGKMIIVAGTRDGKSGIRGRSRSDERGGMLEMRRGRGVYTLEGLRREVRRGKRGKWTEYELKAGVINKALQDIGMGRYNWQLFVLCGFGWFADNLWMHGVSLILPSLSATFLVPEKTVRLTTSALYLGLCVGSFVWGLTSDTAGRRPVFHLTLLIATLFGFLAAAAPSWPAVCFTLCLLGTGVGGNLPVDGALFLEFLPESDAALLTLLSVWWPAGQLASSFAAWLCIAHFRAASGWRIFLAVNGVVTLAMWAARSFAFGVLESPKFLAAKGRGREAVAVVQAVAWRNRTKTWLTAEVLDGVVGDGDGGRAGSDEDEESNNIGSGSWNEAPRPTAPRTGMPSVAVLLRDKLAAFSMSRLRPLFRTRSLALTTGLVWFCWTTVGMGYPLFNAFLPQYFSHSAPPSSSSISSSSGGARTPGRDQGSHGADGHHEPFISPDAYRSYIVTSLAGVPGALLAYRLVDSPSPLLGRRGTLAGSTLASAVFLFLFAAASASSASAAQLLFSCAEAFSQAIMYGVLYAYTPEIFAAPIRGAGTGVASFLNRVAGLAAPVVAATMPGDGAMGPVVLSGVLILSAFGATCLIPVETRGAQKL